MPKEEFGSNDSVDQQWTAFEALTAPLPLPELEEGPRDLYQSLLELSKRQDAWTCHFIQLQRLHSFAKRRLHVMECNASSDDDPEFRAAALAQVPLLRMHLDEAGQLVEALSIILAGIAADIRFLESMNRRRVRPGDVLPL